MDLMTKLEQYSLLFYQNIEKIVKITRLDLIEINDTDLTDIVFTYNYSSTLPIKFPKY